MVDKSEKFNWLVRLGYAARGLVYILIGYLALSRPGGDKGPEGAFSWLQDVPLGKPILYLAAVGLIAYSIYKLCSLLLDLENHGSDAQGLMYRVGNAAGGFAYLALAYTAYEFAQGDKQSGASGDGAQQAASTLLSFGLGPLVLGLIGVGFIIAGVMQAKGAVTASFMKRMKADAPHFVEYLGRAGFAARAVVFLIIGWSLVRSALLESTAQVKTLGDAVSSLGDNGTLYTLVAAGLLLFGVFSLFASRFRIIPELEDQRLRGNSIRGHGQS
jgi:hypothetical protein